MDSKRIRVIVKDILDRYPLLEEDRIKLANFLANAYTSGGSGGNGNGESLTLGITEGTAYEGSEGNINRLEIDKLKKLLITNGDGDKFLSDNGQYVEVKQGSLESIPKATDKSIGGILLGYNLNGKNYPIALDENGKAYVNVPWENTDTTYNKASDSKLGLIKIGYNQNNKNYPVILDSEGKAYVSVPWTDNNDNTTYDKATSDKLGLVKIGYTANDKNYPVVLDSDGKMYVSVPWTDNDTTYTNATQTQDGLMSKEDKIKLDGLTGAYIQIVTKDTYDSMELAGTLDENTVYHIKG